MSARRPRWSWGARAVVAEVDCQGERHRVRWRWGRLVLEDHDLGAEAVLEALGGEPAGCSAVLTAWRAAVALERDPVGMRRRDPDLPRELAPAVEAARLARQLRAWRAGRLEAPALHRLHRRLLEEVRASLAVAVRARQGVGPGPRVSLALHPLPPGGEPELQVDVGRGRVDVGAWLAPSWLAEVAGRGLQRQPFGLVLEVHEVDRPGARAVVSALGWPEGEGLAAAPSLVLLGLDGQAGGWRVGPPPPGPARGPGIWARVRTR